MPEDTTYALPPTEKPKKVYRINPDFLARTAGEVSKSPSKPAPPSSGGESSLAKIATGGGSQFADIAAPFINTISPAKLDESGLRMAAMPRTTEGSLSGRPMPNDQFRGQSRFDELQKTVNENTYAGAHKMPYQVQDVSQEPPMNAGVEAAQLGAKGVENIKSGNGFQGAIDILDASRASMSLVNPALSGFMGGVENTALPLVKLGGAIGATMQMNPEGAKDFITANPNPEKRDISSTEEIGSKVGSLATTFAELSAMGAAAPGLSAVEQFLTLGAPSHIINPIQTGIESGGDINKISESLGREITGATIEAGTGALLGPAAKLGAQSPLPRLTTAVLQGGTFGGAAAIQAGVEGRHVKAVDVIEQAAVGGIFGLAHGGKEKPQVASDQVNINRAIKAIIGQESGGNSDAVSPTGVKGKYQITEKLTKVLTKKYLGEEKTRDEILGTPDEDVVGRSYISDLYKENLRKSNGDPEKAMHGLALDYYGRGPHSVGPPPLSYAKQVVNRFRTATGEAPEGSQTATQNESLSDNGLSLEPKLSEGESAAPVSVGDEVTFENGKKATVDAVAKTGEVQLSTGEYATPDDFAQGKLKHENTAKTEEPAVPVFGMDTGTQIETPVAQVEETQLTNQGEIQNATQERIEPENNIVEHQRTAQGENARQDPIEIRQENSGQAIGSDSSRQIPQEEVTPVRAGLEFRTTSRKPQETLDWQEAHPDFPIHNGSSYNKIKAYADANNIPVTDEGGHKIGFGKLLDNIRDVVDINENPQTNPVTKDMSGTQEISAIKESVPEEAPQEQQNKTTPLQEPVVNDIQDTPADEPFRIRHEDTDRRIKEAGLPAIEKEQMTQPEEARAEAVKRLTDNPNEGRTLIERLINKKGSEALNRVDTEILKIEVKNRAQRMWDATKAVNEAKNQDELDKAHSDLNLYSKEHLEGETVAKNTRSAAGVSLQATQSAAEDFTIERMTDQRLEAFNHNKKIEDRRPLPVEELNKIKDLHERLVAAEKKVAEAEESAKKESYDYHDASVEDLIKTLRKENEELKASALGESKALNDIFTGKKKSSKTKEEWTSFGDKMLAQGRARLAALMAEGTHGYLIVDPRMVQAMGEIGLGHITHGAVAFAGWAQKMREDFKDKIEDLDKRLPALFKQVKQEALNAARNSKEDIIAEHEGDLKKTIKSLYAEHIKSDIINGVKESDPHEIAVAVHADLNDPSLTVDKVKDIYSDFNNPKLPSKDELKRRLSEIRSLTQIGRGTEFAEAGKPVPKSGMQRNPPTQRVREANRLRAAAMKRAGIKTVSSERQLASREQAGITRMKNAIEDAEKYLKTGVKITSGPTEPIQYGAEGQKLQAKLKELQDIIKEKDHPAKTDHEKAINRTVAGLARATNLYTALLNGEIQSLKAKGVKPESPLIDEWRTKRDIARDEWRATKEYQENRDAIVEKNQLASIARAESKIQERLKNNDYAKAQPKAKVYSEKVLTARAELEDIRTEDKLANKMYELANRTQFEKFVDGVIKLRVASVVSSPLILGKLGVAVGVKTIAKPLEEMAGGVIGHLPGFRQIFKRAPIEGGFSLAAEKAALHAEFTVGMKSAWDKAIHMKDSEVERVFGKLRLEIPTQVDRVFYLHDAVKAPIFQNFFARAFMKGVAFAEAERPGSTSERSVIDAIGKRAIEEGLRAKFQQDNFVSRQINRTMQTLGSEETNPVYAGLAKILIKLHIPISTTPLNIFGEANEYMTGLISGSVRTALAFKRGIENLTPENADLIARKLKKGAVGLPLITSSLLAGYNAITDDDEKKPPGILIHTPQAMEGLLFYEIGKNLKKMSEGDETMIGAIAKPLIGEIERLPFLSMTSQVSGAFRKTKEAGIGKGMEKYAGDVTGSVLVPGFLQDAARISDQKQGSDLWDYITKSNTIKRSPENIFQIWETMIPGLRQRVPEYEPKGSGGRSKIKGR